MDIIDSIDIRNVAKQLHVQFSHYLEPWDSLDTKARRPYIKAATILVAARNKSNQEHG